MTVDEGAVRLVDARMKVGKSGSRDVDLER